MVRLIDADVLKRQIESPYTEYPIMIQIRKALKDFIDDAPSIDIEPKRGEWVNTAPSYRSDNIICDQCGYNSIARYDYCPNCGARMKGADDEDI